MRPLTGVPALEEDEFLSVEASALEAATGAGRRAGDVGSEEAQAASQLLQLVRTAAEREDFFSRSELVGGDRWLFYCVVCWTAGTGEPIGFVRQFNPQRGLGTGRLLTAYRNVLERVDDPVFFFDQRFDLIVTQSEIAVLNLTAFDRLFADLDLAREQVPAQAALLQREVGLPVAPAAMQNLVSLCRDRPSLARRLRRVAQFEYLSSITPEAWGQALGRHGLAPDRFGSGDEIELRDPEDVIVFLDMLDELYFETDFSGERRRADRFSLRQ